MDGWVGEDFHQGGEVGFEGCADGVIEVLLALNADAEILWLSQML